MSPSVLVNIQKSQSDYYELVSAYRDNVESDDISFKNIAMILDEIKIFWLERLKIIEFELEELTKHNSCFLLCGAIYLNVNEYEHFYFKSMGDYHLLPDPSLKMETFFRVPEKAMDTSEVINYFKRVYNDTIEILSNFRNHFFILPIWQIAIDDDDEQHELLEKYFISFISNSFDEEYERQEDFCAKFKTYEQIEKEMIPYIREHLIFNSQEDSSLSLREKIERYRETQMSFYKLTQGKSEPHIFLLVVYSLVSQIIDILLVCLYLSINPYIRFNTTFHYLVMIMYTFIENKELKEMIEKTIVFYIFRKTIDEITFTNISFSDYCAKIQSKNILNNILKRVHEQRIDIFKGGVRQVEFIIEDEFRKIIAV